MGKLKLQTSIPRLSYLVCLEGTLGVHSSAIGIHRKIRIKERNGQDCEQGSPFRWARKGQAGLCRYGGCLAGKGSEGTRFYQNGGCPGPQDPGKGCSWCSGHFPRHFRGRQMKNLNKRSPPSPLLLSLPAPAFRTVAGARAAQEKCIKKKRWYTLRKLYILWTLKLQWSSIAAHVSSPCPNLPSITKSPSSPALGGLPTLPGGPFFNVFFPGSIWTIMSICHSHHHFLWSLATRMRLRFLAP